MDPRSEVLLRQAEHFENRPLLLAGLPADDLLGALPQAHGWSWHAAEHAILAKRFANRCTFGTQPGDQPFDGAILFLPKSRELADYLLQVLAARLPGQDLFVVGEKRGGIEGASRQLKTLGTAVKLDSARHCQLWKVRIEHPSQSLDLEQRVRYYPLPSPLPELAIATLPGVFSQGRLDRGSALLLEHLDGLAHGHYLDFGCGSGVLGAVLKQRYPDAQVTLLDCDAFALACSRMTLEQNHLSAEVLAASGIDQAPQGLAAIISNPPFHQGVHTDYQATERMLSEAVEHLRPGGELRLVANSFLKYAPLIEARLGNCKVLAERDGFRVYQASKGLP